jgi:hypothetical protein
MSVAIAPSRFRLTARHMMWLPAALLLTWGVLAAAGMPLTPSSRAAATGSATVSATVTPDMHMGGTCPGGNYTDANLAIGDVNIGGGSCTLTFGTNNGAVGAVLTVESARPSGNTFCQAAVAVACGANPAFTNAPTAGAAALAAGEFGAKVSAAPTCNGGGWTNGNFYGIRDATTAPGTGDTLCTQNGTTDGSYTLQFHSNRSAGTTAGTYNAQINFTSTAS